MKEEINPEIKKRLLKKWRWILTRYTKLKNDNWIKVTKKWNTTIRKDYTLTKDYYLNEIEKANKIILKLTK